MRGHLRDRGNDTFDLVVFVGTDEKGKARYRSRRFHGKKREAQRELARLINEVSTGAVSARSRETVGDYLQKWLVGMRSRVSRGSWADYDRKVRLHLVPQLGKIKLEKLTAADIRAAHTRMLENGRHDGKGGLSPRTVASCHEKLAEALKQAVVDGLITRNPASQVKRPQIERRELQVLEADQVAHLLKAAEGHWLWLPVLIGATCGLRRNETLGLRWKDVDLDRAELTVNQQLERVAPGQYQFCPPKTKASRRMIRLPQVLVDALRRHRADQFEERQRVGENYVDHGLVVCHESGLPRSQYSVTSSFARLVRRAGLPPTTFHGLRHGHASDLLARGEQVLLVSKRLGHANITVTLQIYGHLLKGQEDGMVGRLDHVLRKAMGED